MEKPLVSIVCLTYQKFERIYRTIDSILSQDYPRIQFIIADDGSDNFPYDEIQQYVNKNKKNNIKEFLVIHKEKNEGTVKNINNAYKKANGEYLVPIAGDDEFYSFDVISKIVNVFIEYEYDFFITSRARVDDDDNIIEISPTKFEKHVIKNKINTKKKQYKATVLGELFDVLSGSITYTQKAFLEKWGYFDERYYLLEDLPFYTQYLINNKISFAFDIVSIKYRKGGVSDLNNPHPLFLEDIKTYQSSDMVACENDYGAFFARKIKYTIRRFWIKEKKELLFLYISHPFIFLSNVVYQIKSRLLSQIIK